MEKVTFYTWKIDKDGAKIIEGIGTVLDKMLGEETEKETIELASYGEFVHQEGWGICFGHLNKITDGTDGQIMEFPVLELLRRGKDNTQYREAALESLEVLANAIKDDVKEEPTTTHVETQGVSVGEAGTDIQVAPHEIDYLNKIKDLLGGGKVVITKGDVRIEVE